MKTIYIIDDEKALRENISYALNKEGYKTETFSNGLEGWNGYNSHTPDLIVLDIMMPQMDGMELCRKIRAVNESVPIIFLSSRDEELDRILGLEMGGDDYLCKPFSMKELLVRIRVILRRTTRIENPLPLLQHGSLSLDLQKGICYWKELPVQLTITELRILEKLLSPVGFIRTREQLMQIAFPEDNYINDRALDSHIKRLRKKICLADPLFDNISAIYGLGYRYKEDRDEGINPAPSSV